MKAENTKPKTEGSRLLRSRIFLYLTEFFAGMSVMAVELGASRLLAPYFSSSQIVWTIIIGTIMVAMALGNLYGGKKADKNPDKDKVFGRILIASLWIAAIPVAARYIIAGIAAVLIIAVNSNFLVIAGFAACMIIFVFPLFLLGTVTPSMIKLTVSDLEESGRVSGRLSAANTIGSIIGTFVPTFVSIPAVGTSVTFLIFAGILLALSVIYFIGSRRKLSRMKKVPVGIALFVLCCIFGSGSSFAFWQSDLTYEGESVYNYLQVSENDREVILSTNVMFGVQSVYRKDGELTGLYYDYALASLPMADVPDGNETDVLILGNGTGTFASQCSRYFENARICGVEIDEKITDLGVRYFDLPAGEQVVTYDGRAYLNIIPDLYDVIFVDAYQDITIPFQMSSIEFFSLVRDHLKENGVMVVNMNMKGEETGQTKSADGTINQYLADTIARVFSQVYTADVAYTTNRELFASNAPQDIASFSAASVQDERLNRFLLSVRDSLVPYEPGEYLLTDDRAPVELLGMRTIDALIRSEVSWYKEIYRQEGLQGLIGLLR